MLNILTSRWILRCTSLRQKQALFDHAAARGLPVMFSRQACRDDRDYDLGMLNGLLMSYHYPGLDDSELDHWTEADFRDACDRYARSVAHGNG